MFNFWELPNKERRHRVDQLISEQKTDMARWIDPLNADGAIDHSRSEFTAKFICPNSTVIDIGCGAMALKTYLPSGCTYTPCDVVKRSSDCVVADLNQGQFPEGYFDYVVLLGVLEYVFDVSRVLTKCRLAGNNLLLDYNSQYLSNKIQRRNCGWVSDFSVGEMVDSLITAGWKNIALRKVVDGRYMYICDRIIRSKVL